MNHFLKKFAVVVMAVSSVGVASIAAQSTPTFDPNGVVNVRSGPGLNYTVRAASSDSFTITGRFADFNVAEACSGGIGDNQNAERWLRVEFGNGEGWVWRCAGTVSGDVANLPVAAPAAGLTVDNIVRPIESKAGDLRLASGDGIVVFVTSSTANVRQSPSVSSERVGLLRAVIDGETYTMVNAVGRNASGTWVQVSYQVADEVTTGWMARFLLLLPRDWQDRVPVTQ